MVDIHAHILPGVDDGPVNWEESIALLHQAKEEGIEKVIVTPHANHFQYYVEKEIILQQFAKLQEKTYKENIDIEIYVGQEIHLQSNIVERLENEEFLTLANSKYVLIELPSSGVPNNVGTILQQIVSLGYIPIIAHPERNRGIAERPELLERMIMNGALAQITAGSIVGHFGKNVQKLSMQLIEANLIHLYGSDVHNSKTRPFLFEKGIDYLERQKLAYMADILLENNTKVLMNKPCFLMEPEQIKRKKWWNIISS